MDFESISGFCMFCNLKEIDDVSLHLWCVLDLNADIIVHLGALDTGF